MTRRRTVLYAAQGIPKIDEEIAEKRHSYTRVSSTFSPMIPVGMK
jgi:hypothetical protein